MVMKIDVPNEEEEEEEEEEEIFSMLNIRMFRIPSTRVARYLGALRPG
jgi:hypothetical protein